MVCLSYGDFCSLWIVEVRIGTITYGNYSMPYIERDVICCYPKVISLLHSDRYYVIKNILVQAATAARILARFVDLSELF